MNFGFNDEQELLRNTARKFFENECGSDTVRRLMETPEGISPELWKKIAEQGWLGLIYPESCDGMGLGLVDLVVLMEEMGRAVVPGPYFSSVLLGGLAILEAGHEAQKKEWLPRLCSGEALGCFALTEPDAGSDPASLRTRATKTESGWTITGNKMWISMGSVAELALIFAQTDPEKKHKGLACFLVPTDSEGFTTQEIHGKLGLRSSDTGEISLDSVEVGDDVLTAGGIHGTVREIEGEIVRVEIAPGTTVRLDRRAVAAVAQEPEPEHEPEALAQPEQAASGDES